MTVFFINKALKFYSPVSQLLCWCECLKFNYLLGIVGVDLNRMDRQTDIQIHTHVYTYVCVHTHNTHTHTHTHTHTRTLARIQTIRTGSILRNQARQAGAPGLNFLWIDYTPSHISSYITTRFQQ